MNTSKGHKFLITLLGSLIITTLYEKNSNEILLLWERSNFTFCLSSFLSSTALNHSATTNEPWQLNLHFPATLTATIPYNFGILLSCFANKQRTLEGERKKKTENINHHKHSLIQTLTHSSSSWTEIIVMVTVFWFPSVCLWS